MPNLTLAITDQTKKKMNDHPNIRWSNVVRAIIEQKLEDFEIAEKIAKKSKFSQEDADFFAEKINKTSAKHARRLLNENNS